MYAFLISAPPTIYLEKTLDDEKGCLFLTARIKSCLPIENYIWKKSKSVIHFEDNPKYCVTMTDSKDSITMAVSSLDETDEGIYTFSAENSCERGYSNPVSFAIPQGKTLNLSQYLYNLAWIKAGNKSLFLKSSTIHFLLMRSFTIY